MNDFSKQCLTCKTIKSLEDFYFDISDGRHQASCKNCKNSKRKTNEGRNKRREANAKPSTLAAHKRYRLTAKGRFTQLKAQAKQRGKEVLLTLEEYEQLIVNTCVYCTLPLDVEGCGLDRIDMHQGYVLANVVPCCGFCNYTRGFVWTQEEMFEIGKIVKQLRLARIKAGILRVTLHSFRKGIKF